jgi:hypothetical protein
MHNRFVAPSRHESGLFCCLEMFVAARRQTAAEQNMVCGALPSRRYKNNL